MLDLDKTLERFDPRNPHAAFSYGIPLLLAFGSSFFGPEIVRAHFDGDHSPLGASITFLAHYVFWVLVIASCLFFFSALRRARKRSRRLKTMQMLGAARPHSTVAPSQPNALSPYEAMDSDEQAVLKMFIDRGVSELFLRAFRTTDEDLYRKRQWALARLSQRKYLLHVAPRYRAEEEKYILLSKHFAHLSAHPTEVGSDAPVRHVA